MNAVAARTGRVAALAGVLLAASSVGAAAPAVAAPTAPAAPTSVALPAPAPAQFADDGLGLEGTSTYTIDPAGGAIHVAVDLLATNLVAPSYGSFVIRYAYFDQIGVPVLAEVTNLAAAAGDGTPLTVTVEAEPGSPVSFAVVDLPSNLDYEETQQLRITYDLPDQGPRADGITRVNPAYSAVVPLPVGDPGFATVRVVVPAGLSVEQLGGSTLEREGGSDPISYAAAAIADPITWDATLVARDYDALDRAEVDGPYDIEVRSWPGDTEWSDFVVRHVGEGVPILEELIGQDWPVDRRLRIEETVSPYVYGYAGWYDSTAETIEIGDELDGLVVLHELSHAWFNRDLFAERWINEGLAEEFASRTLERLGEPLPQPEPVSTAAPGAVSLTDWSSPSLSSSTSDEQEHYGYNTAFSVLRVLYDEIGAEGLARVIDAAADERIAYQGDPSPEEDERPTGWRRFLDLLEEVGGSQQALGLFQTFVVPAGDHTAFAARSEARTRYDALEAAGDGWTPPLAVRSAMARWDFAAATTTIEQASAILGVRDEIAAAVEPLGLGAPAGLEDAYESADDLGEVLDGATELLESVARLTEVAEAVDGDQGGWATIGRFGGGADEALDATVAAFVAGDADAVEDRADAVDATLALADDRGRAATAAAGLILLVAWFVHRTSRNGRREPPAPRGTTAPVG